MALSIPANSTLDSVKYILTYYGYSFILVSGTIGNLLNIVLFLRKKLRTTSCNNYFLAAAFTNLIALNVAIVLLLYTTAQPSKLTIVYCKIEGYAMSACLQMSRFFILMACFDRYALCSTNAYLRKFCNVHIARRYVIPPIILIWLIVPLHVPIWTTIVNNSCSFTGTAALYNSIYGIIMIGIIPPGLMFVFSFLIFHNLRLRKRRRQVHAFVLANRNSFTQRTNIKDEQVLAMLLVQVLAYVISSTPYTVIRLYLVLKMVINNNEFVDTDPNTTFSLLVTDMLRFVCPFTAFYLFISVSRLYRTEMKLTILAIYRRCSLLWKRNDNHQNNRNLARNSNLTGQALSNQQQNQANITLNVITNEAFNATLNP